MVGAGGVGSFLALILSVAGFSFKIYDDDIVEDRNSAQLFSSSQIGDSKVTAIKEVCQIFNNNINISIYERQLRIINSNINVLFLGVDNNESRKEIVESSWENVDIIIDGRAELEQYDLFVIADNVKYEDKILTKSEAKDLYISKYCTIGLSAPTCSLKQTPHILAMLAGNMVDTLSKYLHRKHLPEMNIDFHKSYSTWY